MERIAIALPLLLFSAPVAGAGWMATTGGGAALSLLDQESEEKLRVRFAPPTK